MSYKDTTALTTAIFNHASVTSDGYVFVIGGFTGAAYLDQVRSSPINSDGSIGSWSGTTALPATRASHAAAVVRRESNQTVYILVIGGGAGAGTNSIYYAAINGAGTVGAWTTAANFPETIQYHSMVVFDQWVYVIGGNNGATIATVRRNTIAGIIDGTAWTTVSALPAARQSGQCLQYQGVIYFAGGNSGAGDVSTSYSARINQPDGVLTWSTLGTLPHAVSQGLSWIHEDQFFVSGGTESGTYTTKSIQASVLSDGGLSDWTTLEALPAARGNSASIVYGEFVIVTGGFISAAASASVVYDYVQTLTNFIEFSSRDRVGFVKKLHVYYDGAIQFRYSDKWFSDTNDHDPRMLSVGNVVYGFGNDHVPISSDVEVVLDNTDEVADWWVDRATVKNAKKSTCRLFLGAYDTQAATATIHWKMLGEFSVTSNPERDAATVRFGMSDNIRGIFDNQVQTPTVGDWVAADTASPFSRAGTTFGFKYNEEEVAELPIPVVFGREETWTIRVGQYFKTTIPTGPQHVYIVGCFVDGSAANQSVANVHIGSAQPIDIPSTFKVANLTTIWAVTTSPAFTKFGKSWKVIYVTVSENAILLWNFQMVQATGVSRDIAEAMATMRVVMNDTTLTPEAIVVDLIAYYLASGNSAALNLVSSNRLEDSAHMDGKSNASGILSNGNTMREALGQICDSWDIDMFVGYSGKLGLTGRTLDYEYVSSELDSLPAFDEEEMWEVSERHASKGQRWSPVNRIFYSGLKSHPLTNGKILDQYAGPRDNPDAEWGTGVVESTTVSVAWRWWEDGTRNPWTYRGIDSATRPLIAFKTWLRALRLEPGDYFRLTWTRNKGASDPYTSDVFRVEEINVNLSDGGCDVSAVYMGDEITPFILDQQSLLEKYNQSTGGSATVNDGSSIITFSAGSLTVAGVVAGDHLLLKETSESRILFTRYRALKIASVDSATQVTISDSDLDFDAPAPTAVASWEIRRSHLTLPATAIPNYPDGAGIYGKVSSAAHLYSDATSSHKLLDG